MAFTHAKRAREVDSGQTIDSLEQMDGVCSSAERRRHLQTIGVRYVLMGDLHDDETVPIQDDQVICERGGNRVEDERSSMSGIIRGMVIPIHAGILRTVGEGQSTRRRALTVDMLPAFFSKIDTTAYDNLLMGTMVVVGVFGLFRVGEICYSSTNKERVIRIMDVKWSEEGMTIRLRSSKTDIGKAGINKFITNTTDFWPDPCKLMKSIIMGKTRGYGPNDPVFTTKQGQHISRTRLVTFMREGLSKAFPNIPATDWSGISLRRGGATSAARAGIPGEIIERLGHWRSNVYKRYLDFDDNDTKAAQLAMTKLAAATS